jgi:hypothetical protein
MYCRKPVGDTVMAIRTSTLGSYDHIWCAEFSTTLESEVYNAPDMIQPRRAYAHMSRTVVYCPSRKEMEVVDEPIHIFGDYELGFWNLSSSSIASTCQQDD